MKRIIFFLAMVLLIVFAGCSKDGGDDPGKPEIKNNPPVISSINFEKKIFGLNQVTIVDATVTDPENDEFEFSWSSGTQDLGKENKLKLHFLSLGEKELTLKATDKNGNSSSLTSKFTVVESDFGFAVWGDGIDIIKRSETGNFLGDNASIIYHFLGDGYDRYYTFSNSKLVSGSEEYQYTPKVLQPTQYAIAWTLYEETLAKLTIKFGTHTSLVFSVQPTGDKTTDGLSLINGAGIEAKFSNSRTKATLTVYRKGTTTVCYKTAYSENK